MLPNCSESVNKNSRRYLNLTEKIPIKKLPLFYFEDVQSQFSGEQNCKLNRYQSRLDLC